MPIDTDKPESPGWWLERLSRELHNRRSGRSGRRVWSRSLVDSTRIRPPLVLLDDYWRGDPPLLKDIHGDWAAPFRRYVRMGRLNVADLLVSAPANRMGIRDFRTSAANDELGDEKARQLMRANKLKLVSRDVHEYMLGLGDGYTIVTPPDGPDVPNRRTYSRITAESPLQCITAHDPVTDAVVAGLKMYRDHLNEADVAYLFRPGKVHVAVRKDAHSIIRVSGPAQFGAGRWEWDDDRSDDVPGNKVAMVRFRNRHGVGEFERHLDTLDRINDKQFNEWWIGKLQAFRQRAIKLKDEDAEEFEDATGGDNVTVVTNPETGEHQSYNDADLAGIFSSSPDSLWQLPIGAEMWESAVVDPTPLVTSIHKELQHLASLTANPLQSITPDAAAGSAEGADLLREEHVFKIEDRRDRADGGWAETLSMGFLFQGDEERADVTQIEAIWGPAERYGLAEKSQAASQQKGITPIEAILTDVLQYSPADVQNRLRSQRNRDVIFLTPTAGAQGLPAPANAGT